MKKSLYYTVYTNLIDVDEDLYEKENKDVTVYDIVDNIPVEILTISCSVEEESISIIKNRLQKTKFKNHVLVEL